MVGYGSGSWRSTPKFDLLATLVLTLPCVTTSAHPSEFEGLNPRVGDLGSGLSAALSPSGASQLDGQQGGLNKNLHHGHPPPLYSSMPGAHPPSCLSPTPAGSEAKQTQSQMTFTLSLPTQ